MSFRDDDEKYDDGQTVDEHNQCVCGQPLDSDGLCVGCQEVEDACTCAGR